MAGLPLPTCDPGINPRWKSAAFVWAKGGALVVAATSTAPAGSDLDEFRLTTARFTDADPPALDSSQELEAADCSYLSLDVREDGVIDLYYFVERATLYHRSSRDSGATWSARTSILPGGPFGAFELKAAGNDTSDQVFTYQLRHCWHPAHKFNFLHFRLPTGVTTTPDPNVGTGIIGWVVGTPNGSGGVDYSQVVAGSHLSLGVVNPTTLQPLPDGSLALWGAGVWYRGLRADSMVTSRFYPTNTSGLTFNALRWDVKRNNLVAAARVNNSTTLLFGQFFLNDAGTVFTPITPSPPSVTVYQPPAPTGESWAIDLRIAPDGRPWLLYPEPSAGRLEFLRLRGHGANHAGSWV